MQATTQDWLPSGRSNPCPVCGRTKDGDCRISSDGERVICHHPKELRPGSVENGWAFTGNTEDGRAGHFKRHIPRDGSRAAKVLPFRRLAAPPPDPTAITLARLPVPASQPPEHWPSGTRLDYSPTQWVTVKRDGDAKRHMACHRDAGGKENWKAGPDAWPMWREQEAIEHGAGKWICEAEGEKCADWFRAGGLVATSQPGHDRKPSSIEARYRRLAAAGIAGIVYLADYDPEGARHAKKFAAAAAAAGLPLLSIRSIDVWPAAMPAGGSIDDAFGTAAERVAAFEARLRQLKPEPAAVAQPSSPPAAVPAQTHFRILGWNTRRDAIWIQSSGIGQVAAVPPTKNGLQRMAPISYWEAVYPAARAGISWDAAISSVCEQAEAIGATFTPDRIRGCGVWLDHGRVVWHLGNRIEVDGELQPLTGLKDSSWSYASLPVLNIKPDVAPLTDSEGQAILQLIHTGLAWENSCDGLLYLGHVVLGNVSGALEIRPGLQLTGPSGGGKTTLAKGIGKPLQADLGLYTSGSTAAGIRQKLQGNALPTVIDESEQENAKQREEHLKLLRLTFDGQEQLKGTPGQASVSYTMRASITLIGINATVPNLADRNRLVVIRPQKLPPAAWADFMRQRDVLVTVEAGQRLIRRTVSNLKALLANIATFQAVVAQQGLPGRSAELYGSLLAGAHHLASTAIITPDQALEWLDAHGWSDLDEETQEAINSEAEGLACLDQLLSCSVPWKASQTGAIDVRELLAIVSGRNSQDESDATKALGRLGVKFDRDLGLVVSNACRIFKGSRWANGAHRDRLLEIDGASRVLSDDGKTKAVWFSGGGAHKAVAVPAGKLQLTEATG